MAGRVVPMRFGEVDVLVETIPAPGTQPTSTLSDAAQKVENAWDRAMTVIEAAAVSSLEMVKRLGHTSASPDRFEIEMGLSFTASGTVIVAGASGAATLKVKLTYERQPS
ncbi:CU044_2847 family protein [Nocardia sp. NPDC127579]|uniref:CU044_2847 family protein n=1 Tax=Nocardia sp. NPDC127579 TaxID=3345402 RepID=UPI003638BA74